MTALRLLLVGFGLLLAALMVVTSFATWTEPSVFAVRFWFLQVLTVAGCGSVLAAAVVSALTADRRVPAPEPTVDHFS